jgi:type IV pilus assembly protein PilC
VLDLHFGGETDMLLSKRLPLSSLIELCRVMRHNLSAGLTLRHVFKQQANRGPVGVRPIADRVSQQLQEGESLQDALEHEKQHFPPLFTQLVTVGEQSGSLPEIFEELENYFALQLRLKRQFMSQTAWPLIQFLMAPFIMAGMIFILGIFNSKFDPLGFGLTGTTGAIKFLVGWFGTLGIIVAAYFIITRSLRQQVAADELMLRTPVFGACLRAMAMTRFCMALRLTMETGMPVARALKLSMRATANSAYDARVDQVSDAIRNGDDLTEALRITGLFSDDFLDIMATAEESGRVVEVMQRQAKHYEEETGRRLTILTHVASKGIWLMIAVIIVFLIFRIFSTYLGLIDPKAYGL